MANPQHLEWLLEGVQAWNMRRAKEAFIPDLEGASLQGAELRMASLQQANLRRAKLRGADLTNVNLQEADLNGADLRNVDAKNAELRGCSLQKADLQLAILRSADLPDADLRSTNLKNADLQSATMRGVDLRGALLDGTVLRGADLRETLAIQQTDLALAIGIQQSDLEGILGDASTSIPDQLLRPTHWPKFETPNEFQSLKKSEATAADLLSTDIVYPQKEHTSLNQHVNLILHTLPVAAASTKDVADRLRHSVNLFHTATNENRSDEGDILYRMADAFDELAATLGTFEVQTTDKDAIIQVLQARLTEQTKQIDDLKTIIADTPSTRNQIFVGAVGAAGGAALTGGIGYLFGSDGAALVNDFWQLMTQSGTAPLPAPAMPTQLPPSISL